MKILVLRLSSLGDVMLTQPVVAELKDRYPGAVIHYLCKPEYAELVRLFGNVAEVLPYRKSLLWHLGLLSRSYDLVIDLHAKFSTWLLRNLVRAKQKVVYDKQRALRQKIVRKGKGLAIESTLRLYYSALDKLFPESGYTNRPLRQPVLQLNNLRIKHLSLPPVHPGKRIAAIFAGAAHPTKIYPLQQWVELIRLKQDRYQFWLLGSLADRDLSETIASQFEQGVYNFCGAYGLAELVLVLSRCDLVISGDSGPMHLAAALGLKQIAIFGATHPRLGFAPLNEKAVVLSADLECQPCSLHGSKRCLLGHFNCMKRLTPELIAQKM